MGTRRRKLWGWAAVVFSAVLLGVIMGVGVFWWDEIVNNYDIYGIYLYVRFVLLIMFAIGNWFAHVVVVLGFYFLPSLIVGVRQVRAVPISQTRDFLIRLVVGIWQGGGTPGWRTVFLINIFLGWTVIGWFVALLMAFAREDRVTQTRE